jgi:hypothetical protein
VDFQCIPRPLADGGIAAGVLARCAIDVGNEGREGRCVPSCFLSNPAELSGSQSSGCGGGAPGRVCTPCFNLEDGTPTGVCSLNGDRPTTSPPAPSRRCGAFDGGAPAGTCVPKGAVLGSGAYGVFAYAQDDCDAGFVCEPTLKAEDPNACFTPCTTNLGGAYSSGVCVPTFLIRDISALGVTLLSQGDCAVGELCGPCDNPLNPNTPSHLCE